MAKYAVITCTDGNFLVREQHETRDSAVIGYDNLHASLTNDKNMQKGSIKILDDQLDVLEGKWQDTITHNVQPTPKPTPEPEPEPTEE